jgi:YHS domain-containing protein
MKVCRGDGKYEAECANCGKIFEKRIGQHPCYKQKYNKKIGLNKKWGGKHFCSHRCNGLYYDKKVNKPCGWCGKNVERKYAEYKSSKSGQVFCNKSCACSYNNTKRQGMRRSKSESLLHKLIVEAFPDLEVITNDRKLLDGYELDIAIPSLKLAIEWNGIVHFKPIYGQKKFDRIQQIDTKKRQKAKEVGIDLIVIADLVSTQEYVIESFQKIKQIIESLT